MVQRVQPVQTMVVKASNPREIRSADYQPITDPANVKRFIADYFSDIPVLQKIAMCESTDRHFNKDGTVRRGAVNAYDVGVMQINELYHDKEAKALGLDLENIDDNVAFARHLYERSGSKPWVSSSPCWDKTSDLAVNKN